MNRSFFVSSFLALAVLATGCAATSASPETTTHESAVAAGVTQVVATSAGKVLADAQGLSLYTFDRDTTSESTCYNQCAATWPALVVSAAVAATVEAPFGVTTRADGAQQITLDGHPLYTFAGDSAPGDVNGDGLGGVWHLARPAK